MVPLLAKLRMEHVGLTAMIRRAMTAGPGTDGATAILEEAKPFLLIHLKIEQDEVLASLHRAAGADSELREMLASKTADQALRQATLLFTRLDLTCSKAELADAQEGLRARFRWEETELFPAYERVLRAR